MSGSAMSHARFYPFNKPPICFPVVCLARALQSMQRVNSGASAGNARAKEEGKARQTAGKRAEATSEALENVWIGNESRQVLCIQQAADLFSRSLFSAGPLIYAAGEFRSERRERASKGRGQSALARAL